MLLVSAEFQGREVIMGLAVVLFQSEKKKERVLECDAKRIPCTSVLGNELNSVATFI